MAALNLQLVDKAIFSALAANATVKSLLGDPPRIRSFLEANITFPCCRVDEIPIGPWTGTMRGPGVDWIGRVHKQFTVFSQETSLAKASAILKALEDVLELIPSDANAAITGGVFGSAIRGISARDYDAVLGTSFALVEYTFSVEATS